MDMYRLAEQKKSKSRVVVMFAAVCALTLCMVLPAFAYAQTDSYEGAGHTLTYTVHKTTWDSGTKVLPDGTAELSLFSNIYRNAESGDTAKIVAPGTAGTDSVTLDNKVAGPITYTAVCYRILSDSTLPVEVAFSAPESQSISNYTLPAGVDESQVIGAVSGMLEGKSSTMFSIAWNWPFERLAGDVEDTAFGDKAAFDEADDVKVGLVITIADDNDYSPQTGDATIIAVAVIGGIAVVAIIIALIARKRAKKGKHSA